MAVSFVPPAPEIPGDAALEVFVYPTDRELDPDNRFSDARRLEYLGLMMAKAAYMDNMHRTRPSSSGDYLQDMLGNSLDNFMERAATAYAWHKRVHGYPDGFDTKSPEESRRLFCTYAGAVSVQYGFEELQRWIKDVLAVI
ncbi:hypothetical protein GY45DRAFT_1439212 [Cubamyces sp. BRFM 1775]|nr:hypothetical protein GY45DRAFT_1439212 [Cubamyces sp. BRFM 1775]